GNAAKRPCLRHRHIDPTDLGTYEVALVIGAHRPAEDDAPAMLGERGGQPIAEPRLANVERVAIAHEPLADVAGIGVFLVQDEQHRRLAGRRARRRGGGFSEPALLWTALRSIVGA